MRKFRLNTLIAAVAVVMASPICAGAEPRGQWPSERFSPPPARNIAGQFDYYDLVLSWSPTHCSETSDNRDDQQCNRSDGRRYSFVLHGLWPQYEKGYPELCRTARRPYVPQQVIDNMLDVMPATGLIIHEFRKHGTCSGLEAEAYFGTAKRLFQSIRIPDRYKNPFEPLFVAPQELAAEFAKFNPQLKPDSFAIACGGSGSRLKEIRFCFNKDGQSRACGSNENQRRMCSAEKMYVPPVRSTARDEPNSKGPRSPANTGNAPVPRPRLIQGPH
jgi:ribonuclease T2